MPLILKKAKVRHREANIENAQELTRKAMAFPSGTSTKAREFIENSVNVPIHQFKDLDSYLKAGCLNVWATFRACHIVASVVTSTAFKLMRSEEEIVTGPAFDLWNNPNPWDSLTEMIYQWVYHIKLTGRAYWVKDEVNESGQPRFLYPLLPQHVIMLPDRALGVKQYQYRVNGSQLNFGPEEIIFFRRPHPMDPLKGLGDIEPSESLYNDFINRNTYEEKFLENGAQPSGILTYKGSDEMPASMADMEDEEWGNLKKWWAWEYAGKKNAGKTAMLSGEWNYQRLGLTQQEMSSIERDKASVEHIFMNHGVPLSLAGWTNAANYATARQDEINFRKYEVVPLIDILVDKLNAEGVLFKDFDDSTKLTYEMSGLIDVEQVHKDYLPLFKAGGMSVNELRERMGLEKIEKDNELFEQHYGMNGMVPLEMVGGGSVPELDEEIAALVPGEGVDPEEEGTEERQETADTRQDQPSGAEPVESDQNATPQVSLNGAQIQAIVSLALAVSEGSMPKDTAVQIIAASFPLTEDRAERILRDIEDEADEEPELPSVPTPPTNTPEPLAEEDEDLEKGYGKPKEDEDDKLLPDAYRPATSDDVPEGRACGNCLFFNEDNLSNDGRAWCERWDEYVEGGNYCDAWEPREDKEKRRKEVKRKKPPEGAISSYRDGIRRHENGETGDGMEPITIRMAKDFISGAMPSDRWTAKANRWWGRNERFLDEEKGSAAYAAAQLWGGRAGSRYWKAEARRRGLVE